MSKILFFKISAKNRISHTYLRIIALHDTYERSVVLLIAISFSYKVCLNIVVCILKLILLNNNNNNYFDCK